MTPFLAAERGDRFDLQRALRFGLVPLVCQAANPAATLAAHAALDLQEEALAEALVRQIGAFARFLAVISFSQASLLHLASLAREAEIPRRRAEAYLEIRRDLLLAFGLPVFLRRARRQLVEHQKLAGFDSGVFRSLRPRGALDALAAQRAALLAAARRANRRSIDRRDTLIAGIALAGEAQLATRNLHHFDDINISLINPFAG